MATGKLYRRGDKWYMDIHTGRRKPDGKYERIQRKSTGTTKKEAQTELDELMHEFHRISRLGGALDNKYYISKVVEDWCDHIERTYSDKKLSAEYCNHCRRMGTELGLEFVSELNLEEVEKVCAKIASEKSTNTANKALAKFKAALDYAKDRGVIATNPIKKAKTLKTVRKKFRRDLEPEEVHALLKYSPEPWRTIWHMFLSTGLRRDELRYLQRPDINLKRKTVTIIERDGFKPKTDAGSRTIPLGTNILAALNHFQFGEKLAFPSKSGNVHNNNWMLKMFRRHITVALERIAKIRKRFHQSLPRGVTSKDKGFEVDTSELDLHAMRYTFITELISNGVDPKTVQYLAGHKDIKTTLAIYAQFKGGNATDAIHGISWA